MKYMTFFSKQARKPGGLFGRFYMSRVFKKGNAELNQFINDTLSVRPDDHILEIGFGTGELLYDMAEQVSTGCVEGVDFSKTMVAMAQKKNRHQIKKGKIKLHFGDFDSIPFSDTSFDKIVSVNTIYFWADAAQTMDKLGRLLKPGGKLVLGFHDKSDMEKMPLNTDVFQYYSTDGVADLCKGSGHFSSVDIQAKEGLLKMAYCAVALK